MFPGWFQYAGAEIANTSRTIAYKDALMPRASILDAHQVQDDLRTALALIGQSGQGRAAATTYTSPLVDQPAWFDPSNRATWGFAGFYPDTVEGLQDSLRTTEFVELIGDGSAAVTRRSTARDIRVTGWLYGAGREAVDAGLAWLRAALTGAACGPPNAAQVRGETLCFFSEAPTPCCDDPDSEAVAAACVNRYMRQVRDCHLLQGPVVIDDLTGVVDYGALRIEFTLRAGDPHVWGLPTVLDPTVMTPYEIGPDPADCFVTPPPLIVDPLCSVPPAPPRPPVIVNDCLASATTWLRREQAIPPGVIPVWSDAVPIITLRNLHVDDLRTIRLRFYADPFGRGMDSLNPCEHCGEMLISYLPTDATLVLDGTARSAIAARDGEEQQSALHLIFGVDGRPAQWPTLSCGSDYWLTVDVADETTAPLDLEVQVVARY